MRFIKLYTGVTMAETISVRLEDETIEELEEIKKQYKTAMSEVLRKILEIGIKELKTQMALELLREDKISVGKASEIAGITIYEMLERIKQNDISYGYSLEDLKSDLKELEW